MTDEPAKTSGADQPSAEGSEAIGRDACARCANQSFEGELAEFFRKFFSPNSEYDVDRQLLVQSALTTAVLAAIELILYMALFKNAPGFGASKAPYLFYMVISVVSNAAILWHLNAYPRITDHMNGMMIGMTAGMATGLMLGTVVGATNGIFVGSVVGLLSGCAVGVWAGRGCGIMGVMEGLMAGIMGGTMGPMISVMLMLDNLALFMPLFMVSVLTVLFGLTYMLMHAEHGRKAHEPGMDLWSFTALCASAVLLLTAIMVWGPKSAAVLIT